MELVSNLRVLQPRMVRRARKSFDTLFVISGMLFCQVAANTRQTYRILVSEISYNGGKIGEEYVIAILVVSLPAAITNRVSEARPWVLN